MAERAGTERLPAPPGRRRALGVSLLLGLAASLLVIALLLVGWLQPIETVVGNLMTQLRGPRPAAEEVVMVAIDERSIDALGQWPWPRDCVARMIDSLAAAGAGTIALDVVFSEPSRTPPCAEAGSPDAELARALRDAGNVVLGYFFRPRTSSGPDAGSGSGDRLSPGPEPALPGACAAPPTAGQVPAIRGSFERVDGGPFSVKLAAEREPNLLLFEDAAAASGFFSHERDEGVQQRYDLVTRMRQPGRRDAYLYYPALALRAVAEHRGEGLSLGRSPLGAAKLLIGDSEVTADEGLRLWIHYAGGEESHRAIPALDVLSLGRDELAAAVGGKLVFVGATEIGLGDLVSTPFGEMPGVEVHANVAGNLLTGRAVHDRSPQLFLSLAALLAFGLLIPLLVANVRRHLTGSLLAIAAVAAWPLVCFVVFVALSWHLQVVAPMFAGALALVASLRYQVGTVDARARRVKGLFSRYVSPEVVEELLRRERVELGGEKRVMTVLFSDIRGFTDMSETLDDSTAVVAVLNEFFTPMTDIVLARGGTLDKYMGDAMMAFFGAPLEQPDHARRACAATLAMRGELGRLNERWRAAGRPGLGIGIGLNSGEMTVGNMGSDAVFDYTVIGDAVNLGSRIEGLNKVYGTEILVTDATVEAAGDGFLFRQLDRVRVKGKSEAVALHELMAAEPAPAEVREIVERFAAALALYQGRDFTAAEAAFAEMAARGDGPAALYVERCARYRAAPPPADWDGVERFTTK